MAGHRCGAVGACRRRRMRFGACPWPGQLRSRAAGRPGECRPGDLARAGEAAVSGVDLRLYALVDPDNAGGRKLDELAELVVRGGATLVQLRDKHGETGIMVERARSLKIGR